MVSKNTLTVMLLAAIAFSVLVYSLNFTVTPPPASMQTVQAGGQNLDVGVARASFTIVKPAPTPGENMVGGMATFTIVDPKAK